MISKRLFRALAHPLHRRRFYLALAFSFILFPLVAALLVAGTIGLVVPILAFLIWLSGRVVFARFVGNMVLVSPINYPRIATLTEEIKRKIGYQKPVYVFVYQSADFNTYLIKFFFSRRAIFLNSELLESGVSDEEVSWLAGRFVGYLRARREAGFFGWVIRAAQQLLVFNIFLLPYERALVYTGDRIALAAINGDVSSGISAMQKLLVGRQLGYSVNPTGIIEQQRQLKGSLFGFLARLLSGFPHLTSRYVDLMVFAKAFFPAQFARFVAANPGLPEDFTRLGGARQRDPGPLEGGREPWGPPFLVGGLAVAGAVLLVVGGATWMGVQPFLDVGIADTGVTADDEPPAEDLPPHVHRTPSGELAPDPDCAWVSNEPNDFRVRCN